MIRRFWLILMFGLIYGCEQLIEVEDISNETVSVLAPTNNTVLDDTSVNFSWESLDFSETYQLQIALPNFDTAEVIVEDTLISTTSFTKILEPDEYQWRVRALNSAYQTQYTTQNLTIEY